MDQEQLKALIEREVRKELSRLSPQGSGTRQPEEQAAKLLAVLTGTHTKLETALDQMAILRQRGFDLVVVLSRAAEYLIPSDQLASKASPLKTLKTGDERTVLKEISECKSCVVPLMTPNTVAKLALGITDTLATNAVYQSLAFGLPVFVARNGADPDEPQCYCSGLTRHAPALKQLARNYLNTLGSFGIEVVDVSDLAETVSRGFARSQRPSPPRERRVMTEADVVAAAHAGEGIRLADGDIITPQASDRAQELNVPVTRET